MNVSKLDLRVGGVFHYSQKSPNGHEMWGKFVYREILAPEKLVFTNSFFNEEGNLVRASFSLTWPLEILNTLTFSEHEGKTTLILGGGPRQKRNVKLSRKQAMELSKDLLEPLTNLLCILKA
jgi:uncharacterized protein YndB with AHSA1/START domain